MNETPVSDLDWEATLPMVELYSSIQGEGNASGFPTTFIRLFHCNLRCHWCDTPYSYAPAKPAYTASIRDIVKQVHEKRNPYICLTGGEPLLFESAVSQLIQALAPIDFICDIHIETNGAVSLSVYNRLRQQLGIYGKKIRFIMDYKLPASGEMDKMMDENFMHLQDADEVKFVIATDHDLETSCAIVTEKVQKGQVLFSPVWETMPPYKLANYLVEKKLPNVRLSLQQHKVIWDPKQRGV